MSGIQQEGKQNRALKFLKVGEEMKVATNKSQADFEHIFKIPVKPIIEAIDILKKTEKQTVQKPLKTLLTRTLMTRLSARNLKEKMESSVENQPKVQVEQVYKTHTMTLKRKNSRGESEYHVIHQVDHE